VGKHLVAPSEYGVNLHCVVRFHQRSFSDPLELTRYKLAKTVMAVF
jgi:hypothetical protein